MPMMTTVLGRTGLKVSRMGLGGAYGIPAEGVVTALERGLNYFFWSPDWPGLTEGLRRLIPGQRSQMVIAAGTRNRTWPEVRQDLERYLATLGTDYLDVFQFAAVQNQEEADQFLAPGGALEGLQRAKDEGKIRAIGVSGHERPLQRQLAESGAIDLLMVRYNCAHRGAEEEVFPAAAAHGCAVVVFTALRWGTLLQRPPDWPEDRPTPTAADCYRFVLHNPMVQVVLTGPKTVEQLEENLQAAQEGPPLTEAQYQWLLEFGNAAYQTRVPAWG